ncbi:MAG: heme o synthase [Dongiaceae bacterium]
MTAQTLPLSALCDTELRDYWTLLKPRVMSLVVFTGLAGLIAAPGHLHPVLAFTAILCIAVGSGAAGAINMWIERGIDAKMTRTQNRPLPQGRILPENALAFGVGLACASVALMGLALNWLAASLLAAAILFYVFVYTIWLKPRTPQNIVIGGAAGAFPPLIGWAAVNNQIDWASFSLFLIIFLWTPPHFWALALFRNSDYEKAGIPMLPVIAGRKTTIKQIILYCAALIPVSLLPWYLNAAGNFYAAAAFLFSGLFFIFALKLHHQDNNQAARHLFGYSVLYLFLIFGALIVDRLG